MEELSHSKKPSKVDFAYETLKNDILNNKIAPNFPLKINWLQGQYGYGTTPLRETLSRLEGDHLVKLIPNKGFYTAPVSIDELTELYRTRSVIKLQLLKESMLLGDGNWEADIVCTHYLLAKQTSPSKGTCTYEEYKAWMQRYDEFESTLISAHRSPWANRFYKIATDQVRRQGCAFKLLVPNLEDQDFSLGTAQSPTLRTFYSIETYTEVKCAVLSRDFEQAQMLANKHLDMVIAAYNEIYAAHII